MVAQYAFEPFTHTAPGEYLVGYVPASATEWGDDALLVKDNPLRAFKMGKDGQPEELPLNEFDREGLQLVLDDMNNDPEQYRAF